MVFPRDARRNNVILSSEGVPSNSHTAIGKFSLIRIWLWSSWGGKGLTQSLATRGRARIVVFSSAILVPTWFAGPGQSPSQLQVCRMPILIIIIELTHPSQRFGKPYSPTRNRLSGVEPKRRFLNLELLQNSSMCYGPYHVGYTRYATQYSPCRSEFNFPRVPFLFFCGPGIQTSVFVVFFFFFAEGFRQVKSRIVEEAIRRPVSACVVLFPASQKVCTVICAQREKQ